MLPEVTGLTEQGVDETIGVCSEFVDLTLGEWPEIDKSDSTYQRLGEARFCEESCRTCKHELTWLVAAVEHRLQGEDQRISGTLHLVDHRGWEPLCTNPVGSVRAARKRAGWSNDRTDASRSAANCSDSRDLPAWRAR